MTDKAEALEEIITLLAVPPISNLHRQAASMLTAQAAEIERLEALVVSRVRASADAIVEIASQAAEIDALREQLKQTQLGGALRDDYNEKRLNATIASQAAEIAELRADAERYRWLREYPHNYMPEEQTLDGDALDDAIDAALRGDAP